MFVWEVPLLDTALKSLPPINFNFTSVEVITSAHADLCVVNFVECDDNFKKGLRL